MLNPDTLAKYISVAASPALVFPFFAIWIIAARSGTLGEFFLWGATFLIFAVSLPFVYIYRGVKKGTFTDLHLAERAQRSGPLLVAMSGSLLLMGAYYFEQTPREILSLSAVVLINEIVLYLVSNFWKASVHAAAFSGSAVAASALVNPSAALLLVFLPVIIWARARRNRHTVWQGVASSVFAATAVLLTFRFLRIL